MKYRGVRIGASLPDNALEPFEVWNEVSGFLKDRAYLKAEFHLSLGLKKRGPSDLGSVAIKKVDEIETCLKSDEGSSILRAVHKPAGSILYDQSITYFVRKGELIVFANEGHVPEEWDSFFASSKIGQLVTNVIQTDKEYLSEHGKHMSPPNNDLFRYPALSNLRANYLEGVSAEMWFGEAFWQYAACSKEEVMACDWLTCEDRGFQLYVKAWDAPFTSVEGEQGEVQRRLLKLLFDIDESRPHGGISRTAQDGGPPPIPRTSPPPLPDQNANLEALIRSTPANDLVAKNLLFDQLLTSKIFVLSRFPGGYNVPLYFKQHQTGHRDLPVFTSAQRVEAAKKEPFVHECHIDFKKALAQCKPGMGLAVNPLCEDGASLAITPDKVQEIRRQFP